MQQDNDPKQTDHSTKEWLEQKKVNVLKWPSQSAHAVGGPEVGISCEEAHQHPRVETVL